TETLPGWKAKTDRVFEGISEGFRLAESGRVAPGGAEARSPDMPWLLLPFDRDIQHHPLAVDHQEREILGLDRLDNPLVGEQIGDRLVIDRQNQVPRVQAGRLRKAPLVNACDQHAVADQLPRPSPWASSR